MPKKKKWTKTKLNKELWILVANWIKKRDGYTCWRCKKTYDNNSAIHCSHIMPKGEYPKYELKSWNLKTLCMHCHLQWWHKNPVEAYLWLEKEYPEKLAYALKMVTEYDKAPSMTYEEKMTLYLKLKNSAF